MNISDNALIARLKKQGSPRQGTKSPVALGIGDDAALFQPRPGFETILTCDWFLEWTHFLRHLHPADAVGWKSLARAVSDVAAMGGVPRCFLLSLTLPISQTDVWLDTFLGGLRRAARRFGCELAGGDTTRQNRIHINVTVVGEVRAGKAMLRSGARPGDILFVSGGLGEAELGLRLLRCNLGRDVPKDDPQIQKHLYPEPRLGLGRWLAEKRIASAMMDLSDGLSSDLPRLAEASGVGACIEAKKIPAVRFPKYMQGSGWDAGELALDGGDDYELLFTVPRKRASKLPRAVGGVRITAIGEITREKKLVLVRADGREVPLVSRGWDPFRA
jgi:thiamine-monophosphate kinase